MSIDLELLKTTLAKQYQFDCCIFLEDLEHSPSSTLYRTLIPLYKSVYTDPYRFVFFNFEQLQPETLDHVVSTLNYIDISHWFVLVVTNQDATVDFLNSLSDPIATIKINDRIDRQLPNTAVPIFNLNNKMCAHAWAGLHVDPAGTTKLCCNYTDLVKDQQGRPFNIRTHSITEILNSEYIKLERDKFRQGITPNACHTCENIERNQGTSKRQLTPFKLKNIYGFVDWESDNVDSHIGFVGGHLGNLCNLKCRICNESYSSSIASEKLQHSVYSDKKNDPVYFTLVNNSWSKNNADFWSQLKQLVPSARNFEFLGGEPLLVPENLNFMQWLVDQGHSKDCIFEFVTNGTVYPEIFDQAGSFNRITITISIDNLRERLELERSGSSWSTLTTNLKKFIATSKKTSSMQIGISITVNIQNVFYLPELIQWLRTQDITHYFYNWLEQPSWLSVNSLTPCAKQLVLDKLNQADLPAEDLKRLQFVINLVARANTSNGQEFCQNMLELDQRRNESFAITHKEIAKAMGYVLK
jgi:sulfatase maturation enzyme AslB (radical SAM superfamily)